MGLFDYVHVTGPEFVCSEGHDLSDEEFQSKDFGCTMGDVTIADRAVTLTPRQWGDPPERPLLGRFYVYCICTKCPCFVQARTGNLIGVSCEFELELVDDVIRSIKRTSEDTDAFLAREPTESWMKDCFGPMPHSESWAVRQRIWDERERK